MEKVTLAIDLIRLDGETQPRATIDEDTVVDYANVWTASVNGYPFDKPCEVFHDGTDYWCADGFHRILGGQRAKKASVQCHVHKGTKRDAFLFAAKCNASHGLRRTPADKRHVVTRFLQDKEWGEKSSRWIAEVCDVSHVFVTKVREELTPHPKAPNVSTGNVSSSPIRTTGRDGKKRTTKGNADHRKPSENTGKTAECSVSKGKHEWASDGNGQRYCEHCKEDHPENDKPKKSGKEKVSAAKLVDELTRNHVGKLVRGIDAVAQSNGGKGPVHKEANEAIETLIKCLKKMRAGEK